MHTKKNIHLVICLDQNTIPTMQTDICRIVPSSMRVTSLRYGDKQAAVTAPAMRAVDMTQNKKLFSRGPQSNACSVTGVRTVSKLPMNNHKNSWTILTPITILPKSRLREGVSFVSITLVESQQANTNQRFRHREVFCERERDSWDYISTQGQRWD
mmetsp:Transcript_11685/g.18527  ORF Transcript_11685/g.18527 Transcript_11685/m.18527 type:complete len:156 (-) Transcript_11685:751-1218(-)